MNDLCPHTTLNNKKCKTSQSDCGGYDDVNSIAFTKTADCSNVERCATSACLSQFIDREDESPTRYFNMYPQCPGESSSVISAPISFQVLLLNLSLFLVYYL